MKRKKNFKEINLTQKIVLLLVLLLATISVGVLVWALVSGKIRFFAQIAPNLVKNPGFEESLTKGWKVVDGKAAVISGAGYTFPQYLGGDKVLRLEPNSKVISDTIFLQGLSVYQLTIQYYQPCLEQTCAREDGRLGLQFADPNLGVKTEPVFVTRGNDKKFGTFSQKYDISYDPKTPSTRDIKFYQYQVVIQSGRYPLYVDNVSLVFLGLDTIAQTQTKAAEQTQTQAAILTKTVKATNTFTFTPSNTFTFTASPRLMRVSFGVDPATGTFKTGEEISLTLRALTGENVSFAEVVLTYPVDLLRAIPDKISAVEKKFIVVGKNAEIVGKFGRVKFLVCPSQDGQTCFGNFTGEKNLGKVVFQTLAKGEAKIALEETKFYDEKGIEIAEVTKTGSTITIVQGPTLTFTDTPKLTFSFTFTSTPTSTSTFTNTFTPSLTPTLKESLAGLVCDVMGEGKLGADGKIDYWDLAYIVQNFSKQNEAVKRSCQSQPYDGKVDLQDIAKVIDRLLR